MFQVSAFPCELNVFCLLSQRRSHSVQSLLPVQRSGDTGLWHIWPSGQVAKWQNISMKEMVAVKILFDTNAVEETEQEVHFYRMLLHPRD